VPLTLVQLWQENREGIKSKSLAQILGFAGEGRLSDGNMCSKELRELLSVLDLDVVSGYAHQALIANDKEFPNRSLALQDIVNEVGKRLGFTVIPGLYRGRHGESGHDGLWIDADDKHAVIIETKSSTNYPIPLGNFTRYKKELQKSQSIPSENYSSLIVIGDNEDTEDLEAQIRGSPHAWDTRVISLKALFTLAYLKSQVTDDPDSAKLIRDVLIPKQYTKLDPLVDIVSFIAGDVSSGVEEPDQSMEEHAERPYVSKLNTIALRNTAKEILTKRSEHSLKEISRSLFESEDGSLGICYAQSRPYPKTSYVQYWFALHDRQISFLKKHPQHYLAYHCVDTGLVFIPWQDFEKHVDSLGETIASEQHDHWYHVVLQVAGGKVQLRPSSPHEPIDVTRWLLPN
jgi:hypothetical protein